MADSGNGKNGFASDDLRKPRLEGPWNILLSSTAENIIKNFWDQSVDPDNVTMATLQVFTKAHFQELQQLENSDATVGEFMMLYRALSAHKSSFDPPPREWKDAVATCFAMQNHKNPAASLAGVTMLQAMSRCRDIGPVAVELKIDELKAGAAKSA